MSQDIQTCDAVEMMHRYADILKALHKRGVAMTFKPDELAAAQPDPLPQIDVGTVVRVKFPQNS